jgi:hypothetical protein
LIIACPKCGTENRIPASTEPGTIYSCGKCRTTLAAAPEDVKTQPEPGPAVRHGADSVKKTSRVAEKASKVLPIALPLLFALFPVLTLYSSNAEEVTSSEVAVPLAASLGLAVFVFSMSLLLARVFQRRRKPLRSSRPGRTWDLNKAGIMASIFLALFFSYGHVLLVIGGWSRLHRAVAPGSHWLYLSAAWFALLVIGFYLVIRTRRDLRKLTMILTAAAGAAVLMASVTFAFDDGTLSVSERETAETVETRAPEPLNTGVLPDVYYIVLDRYASSSTLAEVYGLDNTEFLDYLAEKGFYVATESVSNYPLTAQSLRSSLNMDFDHDEARVSPVGGSLRDFEVWRFLESKGYQYLHFGSWYELTRENPLADMNFNYNAMPEFSWTLFQTTWAYPLCVWVDIADEWWEAQYHRVLAKFDRLGEVPSIEEPTFVFAHMFVPHPPFVFNRDGSLATSRQLHGKDPKTGYADQLIATNDMLRQLIDRLLEESEVPPIIILQADEGPYPERLRTDADSFELEDASEAELREKMRIFNAYYVPPADQDRFYPTITPVNSFRLVFNVCFGTDFELLPDRCYVRCSDDKPQYLDVTDIVGYE